MINHPDELNGDVYQPDETTGWVLVWLGSALILGGLACWWLVVLR